MTPVPPNGAEPPLDDAAAALLGVLDDYLPLPSPPRPAPTVSLASVRARPVGIGASRGTVTRGGFAAVEQRGIRLDAVARYELWDDTLPDVEQAMTDLHARLLAANMDLSAAGFLRFSLEQVRLADELAVGGGVRAWRKLADYRVLFEYHFDDAAAAGGLIARIAIHSDPEVPDSPARETNQVTDEMTRWDEEAAPALVARGPLRVGRLTALSFIPGPAPAGTVTLRRTFDGAPAPAAQPSLAAFLAAVGGSTPPSRNAQVVFPSLAAFLAAMAPDGDPVLLGDWDADGFADTYMPHTLGLDPAVTLPGPEDRLEIRLQTAAFGTTAVVYLRALRG